MLKISLNRVKLALSFQKVIVPHQECRFTSFTGYRFVSMRRDMNENAAKKIPVAAKTGAKPTV